jgi:tripartite-type tricarboxylate transporter receptor subunit TctC
LTDVEKEDRMIETLNRRTVIGFAGAALAAAAAPAAFAQRLGGTLHMYVGFPPGGATDIVARLISQQMQGPDPVVVENRAGAGGRIALEAARRARPDGLTVVVTPDFPLTVYPHLYHWLGYDPVKDFVPVSMCAVADFALAVGPMVPAEVRTAGDFLGWARGNPKQAMYGSPSPGSTPHFAGLMLAAAANVALTHVSYRGGPQAIQDLMGGQVPASINPVAEVLPYVDSRKLRVLATTGPTRSSFLRDVPTLREGGYRDVVVQSWIGVFAPAGTPEASLEALDSAISKAMKSNAVAEGLAKFGMTIASVPRQRMAAVVSEDLQRWSGVVKASGFTVTE